MRRLAGIAACLALLAAGCGGGGPDAQDVLRQTVANLGSIRSGTLAVRFLVTPDRGRTFGFDVDGPFAFRRGRVPLARLVYTQIEDGKHASATLVSAGGEPYLEANGARRPLSRAQVRSLRGVSDEIAGAAGVGSIAVGGWVDDAEVSSRTNGTDRVTGRLDVARAMDALLAAARLSGRNVPAPGRTSAASLRRAVRSTRLVVYTGAKDRLLRELDVHAALRSDVPAKVRAALGDLVGSKVDFTLKVANPNRPVRIRG